MRKLIIFSVLMIVFNSVVFAQFSEDKLYNIINNKTGMYLAISKDSLKSGQFLVQSHKDSLLSTKWAFIEKKDGTYFLQNSYTKKYAVVYKGAVKPGALVLQGPKPVNRAFIWKVTREKEGDRFKIRNGNSYRPIGPYNGKGFSGVNIIQQEDRNQQYLYWDVVEAN